MRSGGRDGALDVLSVLDYDETYHYASQLYLNNGAVSFTLAANASTVDQDSPVTITATVKASVGTKSPSGKVSFFDNGTLVGSVDVTSNSAVYVDSNPAVGTHIYTATYTGDANFNGATTSAAVNVVVNVLPPEFKLAQPSPGTLSMLAGGSGTLQLSLTSNATFNGSVALSCSGAPALTTCTFAPASVSLAGNQTGTATLSIATHPATNSKAALDNAPRVLPGAGVLSLATLLALVWPGRLRRVRRMWMVLLLGSITALTVGMSGCGSDSKKVVAGTPTGTYSLTITATSGTLTESQLVTLNVQ